MEIELENLNQCGRKPLFIHDRSRLATATSVKFLDDRTFVTASFVGQRMYLIRLDERNESFQVLDAIDTTFNGELAETDLIEADGQGNIVTSNFYLGSATLYSRKRNSLSLVRDLPLGLESYVHGLRFYRPNILAITVTRGRTGVHFFNTDSCEHLFHVSIDVKTQDVIFLSGSRAMIVLAHGAPKGSQQDLYHSEIQIHEFDLAGKTSKVLSKATIDKCHIDCCARHGDRILLTDQLNDKLVLLESDSLNVIGEIDGFDLPHGIDVRNGLLAVTNYGRNSVTIQRLESRRTGFLATLRRITDRFTPGDAAQQERLRAAG